MNKQKQVKENAASCKKLANILFAILAFYIIAVLIFPFIAGNSLILRTSPGVVEMPADTAGTGEITAESGGADQYFTADIDLLRHIDVKVYTYGRENYGTIYAELYRQTDENGLQELLVQQTVSMADLTNGGNISFVFEPPLEGVRGVPLRLRISSLDGNAGSSVCLAYNPDEEVSGGRLEYGFSALSGRLCFSVSGDDYVFIGVHYKQIVFTVGVLMVAVFGIMILRVRQGKPSLVLSSIQGLASYRFLIKQLVARDFKTKYKRSVLGVLWSLLNPLLTSLVQYFVFSNIFKMDISNFPVYILTGSVIFNFFSESCGMSLTSIVGNAALITKVYVPKYIYPLTRTISSLVNLGFALIPLVAIVFITGLTPNRAYLLIPGILFMLVVFSLGLGLILSAMMVFFRDMQFLWGIISMIWMYCSALFYPASILPDSYRFVVEYNPVYCYISPIRTILIDGVSADPVMYIRGAVWAGVMLLIGALVFKKTQDKFVFHL